ncbi:MAG: UDPGP type 1 family protein [Planctomycetota bacterium]
MESPQSEQLRLRRFASELSPSELARLEEQIAGIDFELIEKLNRSEDAKVDWEELAARAIAPPAVRLGEEAEFGTATEARQRGEEALRAGKVAVILVAGGQGTRLGFDKPKGMFPIGPLSDRSLFQIHSDRLAAVMHRYNVSIPMFVMTSPATDRTTREYFEANDNCGLAPEQLRVFRQGTMPAVDDQTGEVLLAEKSCIALSPDGHGGLVAALEKNGCLAEAQAAGIEYFFYAQVDNPLVQLCDPELIGYHLLAESQLTTQVVQKRFAAEKVGNVVSVDGKVQIIEYSDLPVEASERVGANGELELWAGNIAVHVFNRQFLQSVVEDVDGLPFHRAHKKVPFVDQSGELVQPEEPNAIKFERFVFDLLPLADRAIVVEGDPAKVFAPVKNAEGAPVDTATHAKAAQLALFREWLVDAGATVPEGVQVEIHPSWALDASEVREKINSIVFETDTYLR